MSRSVTTGQGSLLASRWTRRRRGTVCAIRATVSTATTAALVVFDARMAQWEHRSLLRFQQGHAGDARLNRG